MATSGRPASSSRINASKPRERWSKNSKEKNGDSGDDLVLFFVVVARKATFSTRRKALMFFWIEYFGLVEKRMENST